MSETAGKFTHKAKLSNFKLWDILLKDNLNQDKRLPTGGQNIDSQTQTQPKTNPHLHSVVTQPTLFVKFILIVKKKKPLMCKTISHPSPGYVIRWLCSSTKAKTKESVMMLGTHEHSAHTIHMWNLTNVDAGVKDGLKGSEWQFNAHYWQLFLMCCRLTAWTHLLSNNKIIKSHGPLIPSCDAFMVQMQMKS